MSNSFAYAIDNDVTVREMVRIKSPLEAIIGQLALEKQELMKQILHLESIAPRRIKMADGKVLIYRCPDELVPIWDLSEKPS